MRMMLRSSMAAFVLSAVVLPVAAHERRAVGPVQFVVGWDEEPAYVGFKNAVDLRITQDGQPVTDVGDALKVEVSLGESKTDPLALEPAFGSPGEYRAQLIPTRPGAYAFHLKGTIRGQTVDQRFVASETTFDPVREVTEVQFPAKDPSASQLAQRIERLEPRLDVVRSDASSAASSARTFGIAGLALAAVALVAAFVRSR